MNKFSRLIYWIIFIIYDLVLIRLILFRRSPGYIKNRLLHRRNWNIFKGNFHGNLTPFHTIDYYLAGNGTLEEAIVNLIGNYAGFIPLGFFIPLLIKATRTWKKILLISFFTSLCFEVLQLITALGFFDVDDLILNTLGGISGFFIYKGIEIIQNRTLVMRSTRPALKKK